MSTEQYQSVPEILLRDLMKAYGGKGFFISEEGAQGFVARFEAWDDDADLLFGDTPMYEAKPGVSTDEAGLLDVDNGIGYIAELGSLQDGDMAPRRIRIYF